MSHPYNDLPQPHQPGPQPGPQPGQPYAPPFPQPTAPRRSGGKLGTIIGLLVIVVIIAVIGVGAYYARKSSPDAAKAGDCVKRDGSDSISVVKCGSADSDYKVVGKVTNKTETQFNISSKRICAPFAGTKTAYWQGEAGGTGYVLCLAPAK